MQPSREQSQLLLRSAGARRWVWNWAIARRKDYYAKSGVSIPSSQLSAELTTLKRQPETAWLKEANAASLQQALRDLDRAYSGFFERRARFPRFKSRKRAVPSFRIPQDAKIADGKVCVPKIGWIRIRQSRTVDGTTKSATFKRDPCGHWHVTIVVAFEMPDVALPEPNADRVIGVDAGLKDFTVLSNGERVEAPKFYRKDQARLRRAQRVLCRRKSGSKRRDKAKNRVARIHQRIADKRKDFLHKHSTNLIKRFDGVCIEDLNVKGLARTKLAKSFCDASHGEFRRQLTYKAVWHRKHLVVIHRFYPSSKLCGVCGTVNDKLTLSDRHWVCVVCGANHDRDHNAASNIRVEGLRLLAVGHTERQNARGVHVRPCTSGAADAEPRILSG